MARGDPRRGEALPDDLWRAKGSGVVRAGISGDERSREALPEDSYEGTIQAAFTRKQKR